MDKLIITPATSTESINIIDWLSKKIWPEYLREITGSDEEWATEFLHSAIKKVKSKWIEDNHLHFLVHNKAAEPIGYFTVVLKKDEIFLERICLTSENRGKRYGKRIIKFIEWFATENKCFKIITLVDNFNRKAIDFFLGNKFVIHDAGIKYHEMWKIISNIDSIKTKIKEVEDEQEESEE